MSGPRYEVNEELRGGFAVRTLRVTKEDLPEEFHGYRIVQLTDFHLGPATAVEHIEEAMRAVRELKPDLLLVTGDFVQYTRFCIRHALGSKVHPKVFGWMNYRRQVRSYAAEVGTALRLVSPPDGTFGVFGNHDHHEGIGSVERMVGKSVRWLNNGSIRIERGGRGLFLAGIDDLLRGKPDIEKALAEVTAQDDVFRLLMSHNPDVVLEKNSARLNEVDLVVCGHTHGGQIRVPGWGPIVTRTAQKEHVSGLSYFGSTAMYISAGIGYGAIGLRLFCPPEITVIELSR